MREVIVYNNGECLRFITDDLKDALDARVISLREFCDMSVYIVKCGLGR